MKGSIAVSLRHNAPFWFWLVSHKLAFFVKNSQKTKQKPYIRKKKPTTQKQEWRVIAMQNSSRAREGGAGGQLVGEVSGWKTVAGRRPIKGLNGKCRRSGVPSEPWSSMPSPLKLPASRSSLGDDPIYSQSHIFILSHYVSNIYAAPSLSRLLQSSPLRQSSADK